MKRFRTFTFCFWFCHQLVYSTYLPFLYYYNFWPYFYSQSHGVRLGCLFGSFQNIVICTENHLKLFNIVHQDQTKLSSKTSRAIMSHKWMVPHSLSLSPTLLLNFFTHAMPPPSKSFFLCYPGIHTCYSRYGSKVLFF